MRQEIEEFEERHLHGFDEDVDTPNDPEYFAMINHDDTMLEMKDQLIGAIRERKKDVLALTFGIFSKIQN